MPVWIALLSVLLTAFNYNILVAGSFGRYEPMIAALGFGGYCCYLALREQNPRWAIFTSNACIALAGMTHPNGLMFFCGLVFLVLYSIGNRFNPPSSLLFPTSAGAIAWGQYLLRSPHAAYRNCMCIRAAASFCFIPWRPWPGGAAFLQSAGFTAHLAGHGRTRFLKSVSLLFYLAALVAMLAIPELRRHRGYRVLLLFL